MSKFQNLSFSVFTIGVHNETANKVRIIGVNIMASVIVLLNLTVGPIFYFMTKEPAVLFGSFVEVLLVSCIVWLNKLRFYTIANLMFLLIINLATNYFASILGKDVNAQLMIIYLILLSFFLFDDLRIVVACVLIALINLTIVEYNFRYDFFPALNLTDEVRNTMRFCSYYVISLLVFILVFYYSKGARVVIKKLESENYVAYTELSNALKAVSDKNGFLVDISHELKQGFTSISKMVPMLSAEAFKEKTRRTELMRNIELATNNYGRFLENVLTMAKMGININTEPFYEPVKVKEEISNICSIMNYNAIGKDLLIQFDCESNDPTIVEVDITLFRQILSNLINNAITYAKKGTTILVALSYNDLSGNFYITVTNEGSQIDDKILKNLFRDRISKEGASKIDGNGLGLHIVYRMVTAMNGNITVINASILNGFNTFKVEIPLKRKYLYHKK